MFKNLTYKKKNTLLFAGAGIFALIIYFGAIKNTIQLYSQCNELETQLQQVKEAPQQLNSLQSNLQNIEGIFKEEQTYGVNYQQHVLETTGNFCSQNNIVLKEFPKPLIHQEQDLSIETYTMTVEGSFMALLKLTYELEQKHKIGKIASLQFKTRKDLKTKEDKLLATLYIQNIKKLKDEL